MNFELFKSCKGVKRREGQEGRAATRGCLQDWPAPQLVLEEKAGHPAAWLEAATHPGRGEAETTTGWTEVKGTLNPCWATWGGHGKTHNNFAEKIFASI